MAGIRPFFLTGANAKIKVNNVTLAFCTDMSYTITVNHATPQVLGMYEASSVEPLSYRVTGSFTIIKYTADATSDVTGADPAGVSPRGNGLGAWTKEANDVKQFFKGFDIKNGPDARADQGLNPKELPKAAGFTIEVFQKLESGTRPVAEQNFLDKITLQARSEVDSIPVAKIRNCRITEAGFALNKKNVAVQTFKFSALYVDEDTFRADFSGFGQQFA